MISPLKWSISALTLFVVAAVAAGAQDSPQYQGVSHPPADDTITTSTIPEAKPPAGKPLDAQGAATAAVQQAAPPTAYTAPDQSPAPPAIAPSAMQPSQSSEGTDDGIVHVAPANSSVQNGQAPMQGSATRLDPDSDIVHVRPLRPGELQEGTAIRVRLLDRLSTAMSESGQPFHTRVATDVMQGGQVVIPAGSEIDGRVVEVSSGHVAGHGTMRLNPETVVLPNGTRFRLHAEVTSAPGSGNRVVGEGTIQPGSRLKRDGMEYGGAVGAGAVTGAIVAGPVGALTGSLIGAGAITVHLLVNHPQATLDSGTTLMFMLTEPLYLSPETMSGN
jgi:hypothetical protein